MPFKVYFSYLSLNNISSVSYSSIKMPNDDLLSPTSQFRLKVCQTSKPWVPISKERSRICLENVPHQAPSQFLQWTTKFVPISDLPPNPQITVHPTQVITWGAPSFAASPRASPSPLENPLHAARAIQTGSSSSDWSAQFPSIVWQINNVQRCFIKILQVFPGPSQV